MALLGQELMLCRAADQDLIREVGIMELLLQPGQTPAVPHSWSNVCPGQHQRPVAAQPPAAAADFGSRFKRVVGVQDGHGGAAERAVCVRERVPALTHAHTHTGPLALTHQVCPQLRDLSSIFFSHPELCEIFESYEHFEALSC